MRLARPNDLILLISPDKKRFIVRLEEGGAFHTHRGFIQHDDILGQPTGRTVTSHNGARFTVLRPSMEELLLALPRATQIVYPKDIGYVLLKLSVVPGTTVVEAGCGSGVLTVALARYVTPGGRVFSYDSRPDMIARTRENLERTGLADAVELQQGSIEYGFEQTGVDALFLDVREPWLYLNQAAAALADGGFFGGIVPTLNQLIELVTGLRRRAFVDVEIDEIMLRQYKALPERVRPLDRMTAHTGYLVFARKTSPDDPRLAEARVRERGAGEYGADAGSDGDDEVDYRAADAALPESFDPDGHLPA